jgi:AbiV family abortive infection protein
MTAPKQYRGRLTNRQIAQGMTAAAANARRLLSDAILLLEAKRWPTAAALAILAIEEAGKQGILRSMSVAQTDKEVTDLWKDFRSHRVKNAHSALLEYASAGARELFDFAGMFSKDAEHPAIIDAVKQIGVYVDAYGDPGHWSCPPDAVEEELARSLVQTATVLSQRGDTTEREIDLWVEHLGPAWLTPNMKYGLILWQQAMYEEGLAMKPGEEMADFIFGAERRQPNRESDDDSDAQN